MNIFDVKTHDTHIQGPAIKSNRLAIPVKISGIRYIFKE